METLVLIVMSNLLTTPMRIDGRQQREETRSLVKTGDHAMGYIQARDFECRTFMENVRSWVAWCSL